MNDRALLIVVVALTAMTLALVYQINGVSRDEIVWLVGFLAGAGLIFAIIRGGHE